MPKLNVKSSKSDKNVSKLQSAVLFNGCCWLDFLRDSFMFSDIETPLLFLWCSSGPILHSDQDLFHYCFLLAWQFFPVGKIPQKSLNFLKLFLLLITLLFSTCLIVSLSVVMFVFNCFINHDPTITAANKVVCK